MSKQKPGTSSETEKQLHAAYQSFTSQKRSTVFLRSLLVLFAGFITLILAEQLFYFSATTKTTVLISLIGLFIFSIWRGFSQLDIQSFEEFYRSFSRKSDLPELKDTLDLEKSSSGNRALIDAAILQNLTKLKPARLEKKLRDYTKDSAVNQQFKTTLIFSLLLMGALIATALNFSHSVERSLTFWESFEKPNPYQFAVKPGNVTIEQGSSFQVEVMFEGNEVPDDVSLQIKTNVEENFRTRGMDAQGNTYSSIPFDLNNDLEYYISMDGYSSEVFTADVQLRPRFSELQAVVIPPEYTNLDTTKLTYPFSQVRAYKGSEVQLSGSVNKSIEHLNISLQDSSYNLNVLEDSSFTETIQLTKRDTLSFTMADHNGLTNKNPFQVILSPQDDEYPVVEILEPKTSIEKVNPQNIELLFRATDDFELTGASLNFEHQRAFVDEPEIGSIPLNNPENGTLQSFNWVVNELNLKPQDVVSFWITVQDNDEFSGYKSSTSQVLTLTVPSLVNYFEDFDEREDEVGEDLDEISDSFEQMQNQYEQFKEKLKENPENAGYEQKRELEQVQKQQEDVQKKIDELNKKFDELKNELSENSMLSEETQQAYEELKKLMEEIDDPAYLEALEKMRQQLDQMNPNQLREAMENLEFNEELYKERLQRTIDLFKQLKLNSDLDKLAKAFEDQARKQEELEQENSDEQKQQQLEETQKENQKLKEKIESLSENTSKKNERAVSEYQQEAGKELEKILKKLQEQLENPQSGGNQQNEQQDGQQQKAKEQYEKLAQMTQSLMENMSQQQMQINIAGIQYALHSLLTLSEEQENLTGLASDTENRSQAYISMARNQKNVEAIFGAVSDSLFKLSSEIPQLSNKINEKKKEVEKQLERSLKQMTERDQRQSSVAARQALGGINEISFMIVNLLEQMQNSQNSGGGSGGMSTEQMMEQLQQSGEQQQQLNQQMQEMINDIQGERLSQDQMERLNQLARQQNEIRKQLQKLQQSGEGGDKIGSELERMIEDMEDTINDLRGGAADPLMIERQQNILSRMLEAENAMQERDEEDKREGSSPGDFERSTPPELTLEELEKQIRNRLNDPDFTKYSSDYQRLIEKYFELLKQLQDREL